MSSENEKHDFLGASKLDFDLAKKIYEEITFKVEEVLESNLIGIPHALEIQINVFRLLGLWVSYGMAEIFRNNVQDGVNAEEESVKQLFNIMKTALKIPSGHSSKVSVEKQ